MQVLEARQVAAGDDQVHALLVLDVEVAHAGAGLVDDPEREPLGTATAQLGILDHDAQAVLGHRQAPHGMLGLLGVSTAVVACGGFGRSR